jgi:hypothetical protein
MYIAIVVEDMNPMVHLMDLWLLGQGVLTEFCCHDI